MSAERYDPIANPYAPGAGTPPPALVGRDPIIEAADLVTEMKAVKHPYQKGILDQKGVDW